MKISNVIIITGLLALSLVANLVWADVPDVVNSPNVNNCDKRDELVDTVLKGHYEYVSCFSEGLARVSVYDDTSPNLSRFGFIDKTGRLVVPLKYDYARQFSEGVANVSLGDDSYFIDKIDRVVIDVSEYDMVWDFHGGLVRISKNHPSGHPFKGMQGCLDKSGKVVIDVAYLELGCFADSNEEVALKYVNDDVKVGVINRQNQTVIDFDYAMLSPIDEQGLYVAIKDCSPFLAGFVSDELLGYCRYGVIDGRGGVVVDFNYQGLVFDDGVLIAKKDDKFGKITLGGDVIAPLVYDDVGDLPD